MVGTMFVLQYPDGYLAGTDLQSGGYPYKACNPSIGDGSLSNVVFFHKYQDASKYAEMMSSDLAVKKITFTITTV